MNAFHVLTSQDTDEDVRRQRKRDKRDKALEEEAWKSKGISVHFSVLFASFPYS